MALEQIPELAEAYLVGGCVRDWLLGAGVKDFDVEVFGVPYERLAGALATWGRVDSVGRSFGVIKLRTPAGRTFDFSLPRRDSKVAPGHTGFNITCDPAIGLREAASRRDFTMNAMMYDPRRGQVLDFFGGREDLRRRFLQHTSPAFVEDPLRVLRGMQFAGRYGLTAVPETTALCRQIKHTYHELAIERVREEWLKWASRSSVPSAGLRLLEASGWIDHFPEIAALHGAPQDPEGRPPRDAFAHTCHCLDALVQMPAWQSAETEDRVVLSLAVLGHGFAKPTASLTTAKDGMGRGRSADHEPGDDSLMRTFLARINVPESIVRRVIPLVANHMAHRQPATDRSVRRLASRIQPETIRNLAVVIAAAHRERQPKPLQATPGLDALVARAEALGIVSCAPQPILLGRHLREAGLQPNPKLGALLAAAYAAQLDGKFESLPEAKRWLSAEIDRSQSLTDRGGGTRELDEV